VFIPRALLLYTGWHTFYHSYIDRANYHYDAVIVYNMLAPFFDVKGTHLRRDTVIPQWFQASKAAAASDGHAVHCWVTAVICQLSRLKRITDVNLKILTKILISRSNFL
jgi:hypothetical protein